MLWCPPRSRPRIMGDADAESMERVAGAFTPVPGGTTPVTTMALARNTVTAAYAQVAELELAKPAKA